MRFDIHPFADVQAARRWAHAEIDSAAGLARQRFITVGPGQDAAYRAKYAEALAFVASGYSLQLQAIPWIAAEATHAGISLADAADRIKTRGDEWNLVLGPRIEALRVAGKDRLAGLETISQVVGAARAVIDELHQFTAER